jgi:hypothetical protein
MSQTIAQRKALAARSTTLAPAAAERAAPREEDRATGSRHFEPVSVQALRTLEAMQKMGAKLVRVERGTVLLRRGDEVGAIEASGRVRWRPAEPGGPDVPGPRGPR